MLLNMHLLPLFQTHLDSKREATADHFKHVKCDLFQCSPHNYEKVSGCFSTLPVLLRALQHAALSAAAHSKTAPSDLLWQCWLHAIDIGKQLPHFSIPQGYRSVAHIASGSYERVCSDNVQISGALCLEDAQARAVFRWSSSRPPARDSA